MCELKEKKIKFGNFQHKILIKIENFRVFEMNIQFFRLFFQTEVKLI